MRMLRIYPQQQRLWWQCHGLVEEEGRCAALLEYLTTHVECSVK